MRYPNIVRGEFLVRPNRFVARVRIGGEETAVHVKNTGRCRELLLPGAEIWLTRPGTPGRKTEYDLVAVRKENGLLVNLDAQAPNAAAAEWLRREGWDRITPEVRFGDSRIDFLTERGGEKRYLEIKGCTLEENGIGFFPDAPTERGVKHLGELIRARQAGYGAALGFVVQMDGIREVRPNRTTHPAFGEAMDEARAAGVEILFYLCHVEPDSLTVVEAVREKIWE